MSTADPMGSKPEQKGAAEEQSTGKGGLAKRLQALRHEAGPHIMRGAATALGSVMVTGTVMWIQSRF
ncbi:hypothetical protein [Streptomyces acidicola]|uniref:Uncharacterized protein n=1 Tax=Streptomyces acidicola TaxID=2596892 RepID=A0A5N8WQI2_9ACTN|nr:hypothetical protein [Streptomyces acidicola]MPY48788.1 hypothetical protein [Streptomyces acidicola]